MMSKSDSLADASAASRRGKAPRLAQHLILHFSRLIRSGALPPGSRLPTEHAIAREHGVSRAVVREAISQLQTAGLVEARQGIGTFVLEAVKTAHFHVDPATILTISDVLALLEFRMSVETESASLAAARHTEEQLHAILQSIEEIQKQLESGVETRKLDFGFHLKVAAATNNRYFGDLLNHLGLAILPRTRVDLKYISGGRSYEYLSRSNEEHRAIYQAIARRDGESARAAMRTHLSNSREHLRQLYDEAENRMRVGG